MIIDFIIYSNYSPTRDNQHTTHCLLLFNISALWTLVTTLLTLKCQMISGTKPMIVWLQKFKKEKHLNKKPIYFSISRLATHSCKHNWHTSYFYYIIYVAACTGFIYLANASEYFLRWPLKYIIIFSQAHGQMNFPNLMLRNLHLYVDLIFTHQISIPWSNCHDTIL